MLISQSLSTVPCTDITTFRLGDDCRLCLYCGKTIRCITNTMYHGSDLLIYEVTIGDKHVQRRPINTSYKS